MQLFIAIINDPDDVTEILDEFLEIGIKGATVIDSEGMGHLLAGRIPLFSRFAEMEQDHRHNKTIFAILHSDEYLQKAVKAVENVTGDLENPDSGVVFSLPINFCKGITKSDEKERLP